MVLKKNQNGFSSVEIILVITCVILIGAAGYFVWHSHNKPTTSKTAATTPNQVNPQIGQTSNQRYLTIKEWDVRAPYSGSLTLTYHIDSDDLSSAGVSSTALTQLGGDCALSNAAGSIVRAAAGQLAPIGDGSETPEQLVADGIKNYKQIGNYYFFFLNPQAACSESQDGLNLQNQTVEAVKSLLPNLEDIPTR